MVTDQVHKGWKGEVASRIGQPSTVFCFFLVFYVLLGMLNTYGAPINDNNALFSADNLRAYGDMTHIQGDHYRIKVHPLFLLLVQPLVLAVNGLTNNLPLAVILVEALSGALMVALFLDTLKALDVSSSMRLIFAAVLGFSFSSMHYSSIAETFIFAGLGLVAFWWYVVRISLKPGDLQKREWVTLVFFGVVSFGITLTNILSYLIGLIYLLRMRKAIGHKILVFLILNVLWFGCVLVLVEIQHTIWNGAPRFWESIFAAFAGEGYEETSYMSWALEADKTIQWLKEIFLFPLVAADLTVASSTGRLDFGDYSIAPAIALICFYAGFLACCILCAIRHIRSDERLIYLKGKAGFYFAIAFAANAGLHYVYGPNEAFMYSPHFLFLLLLVCAIVFDSVKSKPFRYASVALLVAFLLLEIAANIGGFTEVCDFVRSLTASHIALKKTIAACILVGVIAIAIKIAIKNRRAEGFGFEAVYPLLTSYGALILTTGAFIAITY